MLAGSPQVLAYRADFEGSIIDMSYLEMHQVV